MRASDEGAGARQATARQATARKAGAQEPGVHEPETPAAGAAPSPPTQSAPPTGGGGNPVRRLASELGHRARSAGRVALDGSRTVRQLIRRLESSEAGDLVEQAAADPATHPGLATLVAAGHRVFLNPEGSWDAADLQALAMARSDQEMAATAHAVLSGRVANVAAVVASARKSGAIDSQVGDDGIVHLTVALSAGLALIAPSIDLRTTVQEWDAILTRVGVALAPLDLVVEQPVEATRRWRVRVDVPDRPGGGARVFRALAAIHATSTVLQVGAVDDGVRTLDIALIAPEAVTPEAVQAAVAAAGANVYITKGEEWDGGDMSTRALDAAAYLVRHPESAPEIAAGLVAADRYEVIDATAGIPDQKGVLRLQWTTHRHVLLYRDWAPFARAEQARASALLRLAASVAAVSGDPEDGANGWIDTIRGGTVWIRLARPEDAAEVAAMHERTSEQSLFQRYFSHVQWPEIQLRRLAGGRSGATLVAQSRDGDLIGLGNVFPQSKGSSVAELAVLVEDRYHGRGLGRVLLRHMVEVASQLGFEEAVADVLTENKGMQHLLETTGLRWTSTTADGIRTMRAPLPRHDPAAPPHAPSADAAFVTAMGREARDRE